ncbi:MAG: hypothetical protein ACI9LM_001665 [Alteromonadaceae bacterium]|jgi:hypothetical protein
MVNMLVWSIYIIRNFAMQSDHLGPSLEQQSRFTLKPLLLTLLVLLSLAIFVNFQYSTTLSPVKADAPADIFSSERAFDFLQQLTKEQVPHPVDSVANRLVEQRIVTLLQAMGYQPEIQDTPMCQDSERGFGLCTRVRNIIVNIQGASANKGILLAAHYDSVPAGPGGSDAGAAVGTLLETARLLSLTEQPLNSIVLLFNEGEEFGLFGAKAFMEQHPLAKQLKLAINVEARGSSGKSVMFETGENSGWLVNHYSETTPAPLSSSLFYEVYKFLPNDTDLTIFKEHSLQGLNFAHADRLAHYHTPLDNLKNLDRGSLQHHGDNVWGVLKRIKDLELSQVSSGNLVYSDILGLFIIQWNENLSLLASLLAFVSFSLITFFYRKTLGLDIKQQAQSFSILLVVLITSAIAAFIVLQAVRYFSGLYAPWHTNTLPMQLSVWLGVLLPGLLIGKWLVKRLSAINILSSIVLLWVILSVVTSIWLTGVSFLFLIPAILGLIGLFLFVVLAPLNRSEQPFNQAATLAHISIFIILAIVTAILFMPIAYTLELMVGYEMSLAIGVMLGFILVAVLPILTIQEQVKRFNHLMTVLGVLLVGSITWTSIQPAYTAWMPQHLNINYVQNKTDHAFITSGYGYNNIPNALSASFTNPVELSSILPWSKRRYHTSKVPAQQQVTSTLALVNKQTLKNETRIQVQITTPQVNIENAQLSDVKLFIPVDSGLMSIEIGSYNIQYQGENVNNKGYYEYHCRGVSCKSLDITMNFTQQDNSDESQARSIIVMSAYPGIPSIFGQYLIARGDKSVPAHDGDQSLIYEEIKF